MTHCILIGAPVDEGQRVLGCLMGPAAYRVAGLGKVFLSGTLNIGSVADSYATRACPLFGANAEFAREAVEYFTNVRLKEKDE